MKRTLIAAAALAVATPLAAASLALGGGVASSTPPNTNRIVNVQAGNTVRVNLGKVNTGTGYAWKWITKPKKGVATGYPVQTSKLPEGSAPGSPVNAFVRILGLAEDMKTTGTVGLFAPGDQTTPTRTITMKITVTGDGR